MNAKETLIGTHVEPAFAEAAREEAGRREQTIAPVLQLGPPAGAGTPVSLAG